MYERVFYKVMIILKDFPTPIIGAAFEFQLLCKEKRFTGTPDMMCTSVSYTHLDVYKRQLPHLLLNHWTDFNQTWHKYFTQRENQHRTGVFSIRSSGESFGVLKIY